MIERLADPEAVARRGAALFLERARQAIAARGRFVVALAGGSTPKACYRLLADPDVLDWSKAIFVYGDDRCVPPAHEHSNHRMATEALFSRLPPVDVRRVEGDDGDELRAAAAYDAMLAALGPIDLVLLGVGEDGHTASLFPGAPEPPPGARAIAVRAPPTSPIAARVSLSYEAIRGARALLVLVTGASKRGPLAAALAGDGSPIARVVRGHPDATILADLAAAPNDSHSKGGHMAKAQVGLVGLGVMGENLALNMADKGFTVAVYNRSTDKVDELLAANPGKPLIGARSPAELCAALESPRKILMMVKAGKAVDATIEALAPHLSKGDILVDGGNELFTRTQARADKMAEAGIHYVGMGVSGGEEGARHGPSLMPGGDRAAYAHIEPIVTKIAAQVEDGPCVSFLGPGGAGQYVKMIHNGIEYGDMQLIAEVYDLLKHVGGLSNEELAATFAAWNGAELDSFLIEITAKIFEKRDGDGHLVDRIVDTAAMKGTGGWTVQQGAEIASPIPVIAAAVDARMISAVREVRQLGAGLLAGPKPEVGARGTIVEDARQALYAAKVTSYAQGMALLALAGTTYGWPLDPVEIARIWKGGCIIRAKLLAKIQDAFREPERPRNLLFSKSFRAELAERQGGWRRTVHRAIDAGIAAPALMASISYYDGMRRARSPANLIQAQRDFFGAHTFTRLDREGVFHADWS